jgi:hypothetical protein
MLAQFCFAFDIFIIHRIACVGQCAYLFYMHRDEYVWYVHTETPDWDGVNPPPLPGQNGNLSMFTPEMYYPKPRIATHARYRNPVSQFGV